MFVANTCVGIGTLADRSQPPNRAFTDLIDHLRGLHRGRA
jgi:hypothetical protein